MVLFIEFFIVGVISIVVYGLGDRNGSFVIVIIVVEMVIFIGEFVYFFCYEDIFFGVVVGLGVLGVIMKFMLEI